MNTFKKRIIAAIVLLMIVAGPAFAKKENTNGGCKAQNVVGSYTRIDPTTTGPDGSLRTYVRQLNLNSGGTAIQLITGRSDFPLTVGTRSPYIGSWECRQDGKLLATFLEAHYWPTDEFDIDDVKLVKHQLITYLMIVENDDLLRLVQSTARTYVMGEEPTDPLGGTPGGEFFSDVPYIRLKPTDADLTP